MSYFYIAGSMEKNLAIQSPPSSRPECRPGTGGTRWPGERTRGATCRCPPVDGAPFAARFHAP